MERSLLHEATAHSSRYTREEATLMAIIRGILLAMKEE